MNISICNAEFRAMLVGSEQFIISNLYAGFFRDNYYGTTGKTNH